MSRLTLPPNEPRNIGELLTKTKTIAVVGLSSNPARPSHYVASYLEQHGYRIVPVNPKYTEVLGEICYPSLRQIPDGHKIDLVNIFRRSDAVPPIVEEAIRIGAKGIWMQEGVVHSAAAERARQAGLWVVMDRCLMVEHRKHVS
jgi:predicted CoA-binding protein